MCLQTLHYSWLREFSDPGGDIGYVPETGKMESEYFTFGRLVNWDRLSVFRSSTVIIDRSG